MRDATTDDPQVMSAEDFRERCIQIAQSADLAERAVLRAQLVQDGKPTFRTKAIDGLVKQLEKAAQVADTTTTTDDPQPMSPEDFRERCIQIAQTVDLAERAVLRAQLISDGKPTFRAAAIDQQVAQLEQAVRDERAAQRAEMGITSGVGPEWFILQQTTKVRVCKMARDGDGRAELRAYTKADFELAVANVEPVGRAAEDFLTNPQRPEYVGIVCEPNMHAVPHGVLNLYQGWAIPPAAGDAQPFLQHIYSVICSGDDQLYFYVCNALAFTVQRAGDQLGALITLIGEEGAGKGIFLNTVLDWFGQHGYRAGDKDDLLGKHNGHLLDCLFVVADEAFFAGDRGAADKLKGLITEGRMSVEPKFMDRFTSRNRLTIWASTNHEHAVRMSAKDRRNLPITVSSERVGDKAYFDGLAAWLNNGGKAIALNHFLNEVDITGFHPQADRPFTEAALSQKESTLDDDWLFWRECIDTESWRTFGNDTGPESREYGGVQPRTYPKSSVYDCYLNWHHGTHRRGSPITNNVFWRNFAKWGVDDSKELQKQFWDDGKASDRHVVLDDWEALGVRLEDYLNGNGGH